MRSNCPGSAAHTWSSNTRTVPFIHAVSGMMLNAEPARICVTLTTTSLSGSVVRLAMLCSAVDHVRQAHHWIDALTAASAACAPRPCSVTVNSSTAAIHGPGVTPTLPRSRSCHTCRPNAASGFGPSSTPSCDHRRRAAALLLGGLEAQPHVALQLGAVSTSCLDAAEQDRGVAVVPARVHLAGRLRAVRTSFSSWIGSASMSARSSTVLPGLPPFTVATTPVRPTPVRTLEAECAQSFRRRCRRCALPRTRFRDAVKVAADVDQFLHFGCRSDFRWRCFMRAPGAAFGGLRDVTSKDREGNSDHTSARAGAAAPATFGPISPAPRAQTVGGATRVSRARRRSFDPDYFCSSLRRSTSFLSTSLLSTLNSTRRFLEHVQCVGVRHQRPRDAVALDGELIRRSAPGTSRPGT